MKHGAHSTLSDDPLWFKDAIIYEIPIRAFYDANGDGIGDIAGLIEKLDYVEDLGVTAIWLLPFYPSPQRDGGYDISDYRTVNPMLGTLPEFKTFLKEAHTRGLRVITELVINHTSDQHPWFERARRAPKGSKHRDFYVWSDDPKKYKDARIIFQDFESSNWTWDPVAQAYYWHRFYAHQPDLNFDSPDVAKAIFEWLDHWLSMGVDGLRLDAIPYLYERDGTNCENLDETHAFLKRIRAHIDTRYPNRMLLAEANQWPEDAARYFGVGDECHMNFHFPLMPRMFMSLQLENSFPIIDILAQTPKIPDSCQWAIFLRNHDELTLEMVTDEDRDFMVRVYAADPQMRVNLGIRRRLAPLLKTRAKVELMYALLFSMPGTPVLYYGDEIGMGDNVYLKDRDAVRTPMQWSPDRNAGFSKVNPQKLFLPVVIDPEYHYETVNVEAQQNNSDSLLWWTKRLIALRRKHPAFGRGALEMLRPTNGKVLAFFRVLEGERLLIVANLSRTPQCVELDLATHAGATPVELLGQTRFPTIGERPYLLTLGPYSFYTFSVVAPATATAVDTAPMKLERFDFLEELTSPRARERLAEALTEWLPHRRWFRGKARVIATTRIVDVVRVGEAALTFLEVTYAAGQSEIYVLPIAHVDAERALEVTRAHPSALVVRTVSREGVEGAVIDALATGALPADLLGAVLERSTFRGEAGVIRARATKALPTLIDRALTVQSGRARRLDQLPPRVSGAEQTNSSIVYGDKMILKLFRAIEAGEHPEEEVCSFLTQKARFAHVPRLVGTLSYDANVGEPRALAVLQELVPNEGDAWQLTLDALHRFYDHVWQFGQSGAPALERRPLVEQARHEMPAAIREPIGAFLGLARLLGQRTAELHLALGSSSEDPDFAPEPFTLLHQRSLYQSARGEMGSTASLLEQRRTSLGDETRALADRYLAMQAVLDERFSVIHREKIDATRIRVHGDLHLGQVLQSRGDFVFIDFEGEPARALTERRRKRSPLRDVAGMLRSFHYAAEAALRGEHVRERDRSILRPWAEAWTECVSAVWLGEWRRVAAGAPFAPADDAVFARMLDFYLLEKAVYEIRYELNNRPDWVEIPLRAVIDLLTPTSSLT